MVKTVEGESYGGHALVKDVQETDGREEGGRREGVERACGQGNCEVQVKLSVVEQAAWGTENRQPVP